MFRGHKLCGMLAQLVEHLLDVQGVRDSSSLHPTIFLPRKDRKRRIIVGNGSKYSSKQGQNRSESMFKNLRKCCII